MEKKPEIQITHLNSTPNKDGQFFGGDERGNVAMFLRNGTAQVAEMRSLLRPV